MSDLINYRKISSSHLMNSEIKGKKLYKQNENYRMIANVMEHPEFRKFFDEHFINLFLLY